MNNIDFLAENSRRLAAIAAQSYCPVAGNAADPSRRRVVNGGEPFHVPASMLADPEYSPALSRLHFERLRFRHDFEFWAAKCVTISDKQSMLDIPFTLNRPQRRLLALLEQQRTAGQPIRVIMLKARQWGGSTLVQIYFAWIQIIHRRNWNSIICAHVKDTSATIRGIYGRLLDHYPEQYWDEECRPEFRPFERTVNTRLIPGRGCRVTLCSSETQESVRGSDFALAHLSEVAFWKDSVARRPEDLVRSIVSVIGRKECSAVVMESTANGVGNFFHREWLRACKEGESDKAPFFVPWHEIDIYSEPVADPAALWASLTPYELDLWHRHGCTLEAINWYRLKRREFQDHRAMMAEFPTSPDEAFASTAFNVFDSATVERLRTDCRPPLMQGEVETALAGDLSSLSGLRFVPAPDGCLSVWTPPARGAEYVAALDIGGRSRTADWSVLTVIDVTSGPVPEVVAQWRGHIDHDLLAWRAAAVAEWYNTALLIVESNSWETSSEGRGRFILDTLADAYPNLYRRSGTDGFLPGFHTNTRTKPALIANLIALVRDGGYIERDSALCDELLQYETHPDGSYAARPGAHDDRLMSRAIALYVHSRTPIAAHAPISVADLLRAI